MNPPQPNTTQTPNNPTPAGDYGTNQDYLKKVDHDADMESIRQRLDTLEGRTKDTKAVIATFREVLENDRNIDPVITKYFEEHADLKAYVENAVEVIDKRILKAFLKGTGKWILGLIGSLVLVALTVVVTVNITNAINANQKPATSEVRK